MTTKSEKEAKIIADALKTLGGPIKLSDLVDLTKNEIPWGVNSTSKMKGLLENAGGSIVKLEQKGFYAHADYMKKDDAAPEKKQPKPDVIAPSKESAKTLQTFTKEVAPILPKPKLVAGDVFDGFITGIEDYGVFVEHESGVSGLAHKSQIREDGAVMTYAEMQANFKLGMKVRAKVLMVRFGKLSLSLRGFVLTRPVGPVAPVAPAMAKPADSTVVYSTGLMEGPKPVSPTIVLDPPKLVAVPVSKPATSAPAPAKPAPKEVNDKMEKEQLDQLFAYMQSKIGNVSVAARQYVGELAAKHGAFAFMMAMMRTVENFEVDMGLALAKEIERKMGDSL